MNAVYIVMGTTGEYSDRSEWSVCAYPERAQAEEHVERASQYARLALLNQQEQRPVLRETNPYDPDMKMDYTGTQYYVLKAPLYATIRAFKTSR